ncbi:hypothetical protein L596_021830 [Steinernema carpocapsae]|uniref:Uncharacterized protein n=1 Tax=Steinernema carpocapsae TaxID=34508 RepID=A0A4U5MJY3_STECR|nr:hypothetical protein L596_021830 [Steinernema carpocapsae]
MNILVSDKLKMAMRRLLDGLRSPWSLAFSTFGVGYGIYHIIDSTQSGKKYELEEDLTGKTYIVTGATSGIGQVTAEELAKRNARVIMACRNREKCIQIRRDIVLSTRNKQVFCRQCDLSDFDSIRNFVSKLCAGKFKLDNIDGVVNNAATMEGERQVTKDGIEKTIATNHLGTFLLNGLLMEKLMSQESPVRLVFLNTNTINKNTSVNVEDLNREEPKKWDGYEAYKASKLAQALFAKELSERVKGTNVSVVVADPGRTKTTLSKQLDHNDFFLSRWLLKVVSFMMGERRPEKAVRPVLYALADPEMSKSNGDFIDRERVKLEWNEQSNDDALRARLWLTSMKWTKFAEHMNQMKADLGQAAMNLEASKEKITAESTLAPVVAATAKAGDRSWRTLWLW